MKNLFFLFLLGLSFAYSKNCCAQGPTPFYAAKYYSNEVDIIDTTDLTFTVISTMTATSDFGSVTGMYGLALHPFTKEMYVCYQSTGGGGGNRRLGIMNMETAAITDIGNCGNIIDMDFGPDGTLYGSTGSFSPDYSFVIINIVTAAQIFLFDYTPSSYGGGMAYNPFTDEIYYQNNAGSSFIDPGTFIETVGSPVGSPGETQAMAILTPTLGWMANYGTLYTFNPITEIFSPSVGIDNYHAFAFGREPCVPMTLDVTSIAICIGDDVTLDATAASGEEVMWDGGIFNGVPFTPEAPGTYVYTATTADDDDCPLMVDVAVFDLPTVIAGSGDENYCEGESVVLSAGGDADIYTWEPTDLMPEVGTHTYTLTGMYEDGCENTATVDITVHALPTVTAEVDEEMVCIGNDVVFTAGGAETYVWEDPEILDGEPYTTAMAGTFTFNVSGVDANGCENTGSVELEVIEQINISGITSDELLGSDGSIDIEFTGGEPAYMVDWDNDGTGDFDDPADLAGLAGGTYTVIVQGAVGCSDTATFTVGSQLGIQNEVNGLVAIYPNPTMGNITIEHSGNFSYELMNISGELLLTNSATEKEIISLQSFARGIYFIRIESNSISTTQKIVKK